MRPFWGAAHFDELSRILDLTVIVRGKEFDKNDVSAFQLAILNLTTLESLKIIVEPEVLDFAKTYLVWPHQDFTYSVEPTRGGRRPRGPRALSDAD